MRYTRSVSIYMQYSKQCNSVYRKQLCSLLISFTVQNHKHSNTALRTIICVTKPDHKDKFEGTTISPNQSQLTIAVVLLDYRITSLHKIYTCSYFRTPLTKPATDIRNALPLLYTKLSQTLIFFLTRYNSLDIYEYKLCIIFKRIVLQTKH